MPPNRFESEVESFLEGSHGDRTHIKRADHHTVTPLCGTLLGGEFPGGILRLLARDEVRPAPRSISLTREKLRPAGGLYRCFREKVRPAGHKTPFLGHFSCAGRTFSRSRPHLAEQGELFRAQAAVTWWQGLVNTNSHAIPPRTLHVLKCNH